MKRTVLVSSPTPDSDGHTAAADKVLVPPSTTDAATSAHKISSTMSDADIFLLPRSGVRVGESCASVEVRQDEGLDELCWGELEGQDSAKDPWKGTLAALKAAWDDGHFDR